MKKIVFFGLLLMLVIPPIHAQIHVNVNIGTPSWGPPATNENYYYLPDIDSYYDIRSAQFIYLSSGIWIRNKRLPSRYSNYNLQRGNVVLLPYYAGKSPYSHYSNHKKNYNNRAYKDDRHPSNSYKKNEKGNKKHKD